MPLYLPLWASWTTEYTVETKHCKCVNFFIENETFFRCSIRIFQTEVHIFNFLVFLSSIYLKKLQSFLMLSAEEQILYCTYTSSQSVKYCIFNMNASRVDIGLGKEHAVAKKFVIFSKETLQEESRTFCYHIYQKNVYKSLFDDLSIILCPLIFRKLKKLLGMQKKDISPSRINSKGLSTTEDHLTRVISMLYESCIKML